MKEYWKPIIEWNSYYEVSNLGRVRRSKSGRRTRCGKILKGHVGPDGYVRYVAHFEGLVKIALGHRLVATAFIDKPDYKVEVDHINFNKEDNRVDNLRWVTHSENVKHNFTKKILEG